MYLCSNSRINNPKREGEETQEGYVAFLRSFNSSLSSASWIEADFQLEFNFYPNDDTIIEQTSNFEIEFYPQYVNGSFFDSDNPLVLLLQVSSSSTSSAQCDSCSSWTLLSNLDRKRLARELGGFKRVYVKLIRQNGLHLCFAKASMKICRAIGDQKASEVSLDSETISLNNQTTILRTNITNQGPNVIPEPVVTYNMPAILELKDIEFTDKDAETLSVVIKDLRSMFPNQKYTMQNKPWINVESNEMTADVECIIFDDSFPPYSVIPYWNITCELIDDIELGDGFLMDIIGDPSVSQGGNSSVQVLVKSKSDDWLPVISDSSGSNFPLLVYPSTNDKYILDETAFQMPTSQTSSTFIITTNSTGQELFPNDRMLQIDILIPYREWTLFNFDIQLLVDYVDDNFEKQELLNSQFPYSIFLDATRESALVSASWDLNLYSSIDLERGVFAQVFTPDLNTLEGNLIVSSTVKSTPVLSEEGSLEIPVTPSSPIGYFRVVLNVRENPRAQRTLKLYFSNVDEYKIQLEQQTYFPDLNFHNEITRNRDYVPSIVIDDLKAEEQDKDSIDFVVDFLHNDCSGIKCHFDVSASVEEYIPEQLQELTLTEKNLSKELTTELSRNPSNTNIANNSISIDMDESILGSSLEDQYFSGVVIGVSLQSSLYSGSVTEDTMLNLTLMKTFDEDQIVQNVSSKSDFSSSYFLFFNGEQFKPFLESINKTNDRNRVELVLGIEVSGLSLEERITARIDYRLIKSQDLRIRDREPFELTRLKPNPDKIFDWKSYRIKHDNSNTLLLALPNEDDYCSAQVCFSSGGLYVGLDLYYPKAVCYYMSDFKRDILLPQNSTNPIKLISTIREDDGITDVPKNNTSSSKDLAITVFHSRTDLDSSCRNESMNLSFKPVQELHPVSQSDQVFEFNYFNHSYLFQVNMSEFRSSFEENNNNNNNNFDNNNRVVVQWATFGGSGRFSSYLDFSDFDIEVSDVTLFPSWDYSASLFDEQSFENAAHVNVTLPNRNTQMLIYFRLDTFDDRIHASVSSDGDRYQVSSIPMVFPRLGFAIAPVVCYSVSIVAAIIIAGLFFKPSNIPTSSFFQVRFKSLEYILFIASAILFLLAILFTGLSFANDCVSFIECCSFGGYTQRKNDENDFYHFEDQPLNQDKSWPIAGYTPRNYSQDTDRVDVDCLARTAPISDMDKAQGLCVRGETYSTCARGVGAFPFVALALHAFSLLPLILASSSCYARYKKKKNSGEEEEETKTEDNRN